jgi:hypothetical protein
MLTRWLLEFVALSAMKPSQNASVVLISDGIATVIYRNVESPVVSFAL